MNASPIHHTDPLSQLSPKSKVAPVAGGHKQVSGGYKPVPGGYKPVPGDYKHVGTYRAARAAKKTRKY